MIAFVAAGWAGAAEAAPACPPAAQVDGDEPLATAIREMLIARGIGTEVELPCPAVYATVRETPAGVTAVVRDESGRERAYEIRDRDTAATIVESWARHDLEDSLLAGRMRLPEREVAGPRATTPTAPAAPPARPVSVALFAGTGHGMEGSIWSDASLAACVRLGSFCAGALARASRDSGEYGDADRYDTLRDAVDLLATVDTSRHVGRFTYGGGFGFGGGWQHSRTEKRVAGAHESETFGGLRLESRVTGGVTLARELHLELSLTAGVSPLARQDAIRDDGFILAGEPRGWLRTGLGLRYGGP